jgi:lipopolysaccharide export system protein LptA
MKRRLGLVALSFALLLGAYLLYRHLSVDIDIMGFIYSGPKPARPTTQPTTLPRVGAIEGRGAQGPVVMYYDKRNVLRAIGRADGWRKKGDWLDIQQPRLEWYMDSGETVYISSERGIARPKEIGEAWDFRAGKLEDNVLVVLDRNNDRRRSPLAERPGDAVRISMDWVEFDQDRLTIKTSGPVRMYSKEADAFGTGLRIGWSEKPWAVRELQIDKGQKMIIREGQDRFLRDFALTAGPADEAGADAAAKSAASKPVKPPRKPPTANAAKPPWGGRAATGEAPPERVNTTQPGDEPVVADTYVAEFQENVVITSGKRHLKGADLMQLVFETKTQQFSGASGSGTAPASAPTRTARAGSASRPAASAPATQPAEPILVTWTGPLTIKPRRAKDELWQPNRFDVFAQGKQLQVGDERATASCRSLRLWSLKNSGELLGAADAPASITRTDGQRISAQTIHFERVDGGTTLARLDGPGEAFLPAREKADRPADQPQDQQVQIAWSQSATAELSGRTVIDKSGQRRQEDFFKSAALVGKVDLRAGADQQLKGDQVVVTFIVPKSPTDEANQISHLDAQGNVEMLDRKEGNQFAAKTLNLEMMQLPGRASLPRKAHATGEVKARQGERNIQADDLTVTFQPVKDAKTGRMKAEPLRLDASGNVHIEEQSQDGLVVIDGDTVGADFLYSASAQDPSKRVMELVADVKGGPARVVQAANEIQGPDIHVDSRQQAARVSGAGKLSFLTKRDLDDAELASPRLVHASWTQSMRYNGQEKMASLLGDVELLTDEDQLLCDKADLLFGEPEEPSAGVSARPASAASSPSSRPGTRRAASLPSGFRFRPQRLVQFVAEGKKVALSREKKDSDGFTIQSMALQSEQLVYQAEGRRVTCSKPGWLGFNDYRPPEPDKPKPEPGKPDKAKPRPPKPAGPTARVLPENFVLRPSQSAFSWSESMCMQREPTDQSKPGKEEYGTLVRLVGDVKMRQCSGSELRLTEQLHIRQSQDLRPGEHLVLNCGELLARFRPYQKTAPATRPAASQPADSGGLRIGPLELLDAQKKVSFEDKARQLTIGAERILYNRPKDDKTPDMAVILGHLPNMPAKLAQVTYFDTQRQAMQTVEAEELFYNPRTGRIDSPKLQMHGAGGAIKPRQ